MRITTLAGLSLSFSLIALLQSCDRLFSASTSLSDRSPDPSCLPSFVQTVWTANVDINGAEGSVESAEFSPDGQFIATTSRDGRVRLWRISDASLVWESVYWGGSLANKQGEVEAASFSIDGSMVAVAGDSAGIKLYQTDNGHLIRAIDAGEADAIAFTPDGKYLAGADNQKLLVYTAKPWALHYRDRIAHRKGINSIAFTPDNQFVLTAALDHRVKISRLEDGSLVREIKPANSSIKSVRVSPNGKVFATANFKGNSVKVFQVSDGQLVKTLEYDHPMEAVVFSPNGQLLVTGGGGGAKRISDSSKSIQFYEAPTFNPLCEIAAHRQGIEYIDFSTDGKHLVTASEDGTIKLWKIQTSAIPN